MHDTKRTQIAGKVFQPATAILASVVHPTLGFKSIRNLIDSSKPMQDQIIIGHSTSFFCTFWLMDQHDVFSTDPFYGFQDANFTPIIWE